MPTQSMNVIHLLGSGIIRLELLIADRPGWGDAVVVTQLGKITLPEAIERGAEQLGQAGLLGGGGGPVAVPGGPVEPHVAVGVDVAQAGHDAVGAAVGGL